MIVGFSNFYGGVLARNIWYNRPIADGAWGSFLEAPGDYRAR